MIEVLHDHLSLEALLQFLRAEGAAEAEVGAQPA